MALVIGGVAIGAWELAGLAAAGLGALFFASPQGQEATREAARAAQEALDKLKPAPEPEKEPEKDPRPPPVPPICETCDKREPCPPCTPPVGTIAFEVHRVPPQEPHFPCAGDHVHFFRRNQNPNNCQCFWKRNALPVACLDSGADYRPRPGEVPL